MKLFIEAFTEQVAFFPLLRASTPEQLEEGKGKFAAGLKVAQSTAPLRAAFGGKIDRGFNQLLVRKLRDCKGFKNVPS